MLIALLAVAGCSAGEDPSTAAGYQFDGQVTVDRGAGPQPVALDDVPDMPSLALLGELDDLEPDGSGTVTGQLPAAAVARFLPAAGPSATPTAPATVTGSHDGRRRTTSLPWTAPSKLPVPDGDRRVSWR